MKTIMRIISTAAVGLAMVASSAYSQIGIGAGLAAVGDNIQQAGGSLADLLKKDSITYCIINNYHPFHSTIIFAKILFE